MIEGGASSFEQISLNAPTAADLYVLPQRSDRSFVLRPPRDASTMVRDSGRTATPGDGSLELRPNAHSQHGRWPSHHAPVHHGHECLPNGNADAPDEPVPERLSSDAGQLRVADGRRLRHRAHPDVSPRRRNHNDERALHRRLPHRLARHPDFERDGIQLDVQRNILRLVVQTPGTAAPLRRPLCTADPAPRIATAGRCPRRRARCRCGRRYRAPQSAPAR